MFLENPCTIYEGIQRGNVCCAKSCGTCGGKDCSIRPGGYSKCCTSQIPLNQVCGPQQNAPCHLQNGKIICCNQNKPFVLTGQYYTIRKKNPSFFFNLITFIRLQRTSRCLLLPTSINKMGQFGRSYGKVYSEFLLHYVL